MAALDKTSCDRNTSETRTVVILVGKSPTPAAAAALELARVLIQGVES